MGLAQRWTGCSQSPRLPPCCACSASAQHAWPTTPWTHRPTASTHLVGKLGWAGWGRKGQPRPPPRLHMAAPARSGSAAGTVCVLSALRQNRAPRSNKPPTPAGHGPARKSALVLLRRSISCSAAPAPHTRNAGARARGDGAPRSDHCRHYAKSTCRPSNSPHAACPTSPTCGPSTRAYVLCALVQNLTSPVPSLASPYLHLLLLPERAVAGLKSLAEVVVAAQPLLLQAGGAKAGGGGSGTAGGP